MSGFLNRLFGKPPAAASPLPQRIQAILYDGDDTLEVVGESYHQDVLWAMVGGSNWKPVRSPITAVLLPEPDSPVDENAISVLIDGEVVGYLSREDAISYGPGLIRIIEESGGTYVALRGWVVGGGDRDGTLGHLGVFLDHDPTDFGLDASYTSGGSIRTGLSAAFATDLEDDSYDLSWMRTLSEDGSSACSQIEAFLVDERDPIDRHYMFSELAHRLYRLRDDAESLIRFDEVCERHHAEMITLRPALLAKFSVVPVVEMYRQATIREHKAKRWERSCEWALRGIAFYGEQAGRPEVVDDLRKRLAHAEMKIDEAAQPRKPRPSSQRRSATTMAEPQTETLICESCGESFDRILTRGRKPKHCPTCRGEEVELPAGASVD